MKECGVEITPTLSSQNTSQNSKQANNDTVDWKMDMRTVLGSATSWKREITVIDWGGRDDEQVTSKTVNEKVNLSMSRPEESFEFNNSSIDDILIEITAEKSNVVAKDQQKTRPKLMMKSKKPEKGNRIGLKEQTLTTHYFVDTDVSGFYL